VTSSVSQIIATSNHLVVSRSQEDLDSRAATEQGSTGLSPITLLLSTISLYYLHAPSWAVLKRWARQYIARS
jgi:hypothetical protein